MQKVAKWQNDGTERGIKPARFVEKAARKNRHWRRVVFRSLYDIVFGKEDMKRGFIPLGARIALDIMKQIDRIKTGRLKTSMDHRIVD